MLTCPNMRCSTCGYDLYGLRSQRCPECGHPFNPCDRRTYISDAQIVDGRVCLAASGIAWGAIAAGIIATLLGSPTVLVITGAVAIFFAFAVLADSLPAIRGRPAMVKHRPALYAACALCGLLLVVITLVVLVPLVEFLAAA